MKSLRFSLIFISLSLLGTFSGFSQGEEQTAEQSTILSMVVGKSHLPITPSVVNTSSVSVETMAFLYWGITAQYDWAVSPEWTLGGMLSGGINTMTATVSKLSHSPSPVLRAEVRGRWHFDRKSRVNNGFSLRNNSGFYLAPTLGYILDVPRVYDRLDGTSARRRAKSIPNHTFYSVLYVGYQYTTRSHLYWGVEFGLGYGLNINEDNRGRENRPVVSPTVVGLLNLKIGYAF